MSVHTPPFSRQCHRGPPSVRYLPGNAAAIFWPDCLTLPITQNQQLRYRWDGTRMTDYLAHGATEWTVWPIDGVAKSIVTDES
ncbi:MAG: hypothetical protein JOZ16_18820 [Methylobacteriaceae bacterium]|nr:hypothetical protein [Methylobacteriaceae bacterium]